MTLPIQVIPRSSRSALIQTPEGWKLKITAPPVEGAANKEVCIFIARLLNIPKSAVRLKSGDKSRHKVLDITGIEQHQALELLSHHAYVPRV